MLFKKRDDPSRAFDMPRHAQVQRLDALEDLERRHRRHAGAEVAQPFAPRPQQERARPRLLLEVHVVEALVRGAQRGELAGGLPVEAARIDQNPRDGDSVAAEELGRRVIQQVGAEREGLHQVRRGEGRVHQQRQFRVVRDRRDRGDVEHVQARIAEGLTENEPGVRLQRPAEILRISWRDKSRLDPEALERVGEQVVRAAVERRRGDDVAARVHQRGDR